MVKADIVRKPCKKNHKCSHVILTSLHWISITFCIGSAELGIVFNSTWVSFLKEYKRYTFPLIEKKMSNWDLSHTFFTKFRKKYIFGIVLNRTSPWLNIFVFEVIQYNLEHFYWKSQKMTEKNWKIVVTFVWTQSIMFLLMFSLKQLVEVWSRISFVIPYTIHDLHCLFRPG